MLKQESSTLEFYSGGEKWGCLLKELRDTNRVKDIKCTLEGFRTHMLGYLSKDNLARAKLLYFQCGKLKPRNSTLGKKGRPKTGKHQYPGILRETDFGWLTLLVRFLVSTPNLHIYHYIYICLIRLHLGRYTYKVCALDGDWQALSAHLQVLKEVMFMAEMISTKDSFSRRGVTKPKFMWVHRVF